MYAAAFRESAADNGVPETRHDPDDPVGQVARNAELVRSGVEVGRGAVEMRVTDAQAVMSLGEVWSPVALRTPKSLTEQRDDVAPVHVADASREEPAEFSVSEQPLEQAVDGSLDSGPPARWLHRCSVPSVRR